MIYNITLENFKVFEQETKFPLSKLNLLTGINGRGKSSFLQSLLVIRQSIEEQGYLRKVIFNGSCVNLGTFNDVRNKNISQDKQIKISIDFEKATEELLLSSDIEDDMVGIIDNQRTYDDIYGLLKMHYVAADRVGPQEFYMKSTLPDFINVGTKGEFVANVLFQKKEELVNELVAIKEKYRGEYVDEISHELQIQTGEWLSKIFDAEVKVYVDNKGNKRIITLLFQIDGHPDLRPSNVGFGYTYILPIIVSGLVAKSGEILIIENPEAHLHPKAQHELTLFLAKVASTGVQVFIETHSEHILNALRISTIPKCDILKIHDISILYFQNDDLKPFIQIPIIENGAIEVWPGGFFDQTELDFNKLFEL